MQISDGRIRSEYPHLTGIEGGTARGDLVELSHLGLTKRFTRYGSTYRLSSVRTTNGGAVYIEYAGELVRRIKSSQGRQIDLMRDQTGRIVGARDDSGRQTNYEYGSDGHLVSYGDSSGGTWRYSYQGIGLLSSVLDSRGVEILSAHFDASRRSRRITALQDFTSFEYDDDRTTVSNSLQQRAEFRKHASGLTNAISDFGNSLTAIEFDEQLIGALSFLLNTIVVLGFEIRQRAM
jgi:YD repeat-containing protein